MAAFSLRNWRWTHLLLASIGYWLALVLTTLGPPVLRARRLVQSEGSRGEFSINASASRIDATIVESGTTTWSASVDVLVIALALTIPPLLLWVLWLVQRPARPGVQDQTLRHESGAGLPLLTEPNPLAPVAPAPLAPAATEPVREAPVREAPVQKALVREVPVPTDRQPLQAPRSNPAGD